MLQTLPGIVLPNMKIMFNLLFELPVIFSVLEAHGTFIRTMRYDTLSVHVNGIIWSLPEHFFELCPSILKFDTIHDQNMWYDFPHPVLHTLHNMSVTFCAEQESWGGAFDMNHVWYHIQRILFLGNGSLCKKLIIFWKTQQIAEVELWWIVSN